MAEPSADPDRFDAAVDAFRKRVPVDREEWDTLTTQQRERAFTVSQVTEGRVLQDTFDAIDRAVAEGSTLEDFKDAVKAELVDAWGGEIPGRMENIFRTNVLGAYAEGRYAIMSSPTVREARPFTRYDDAETDRECETCSGCGGTTLPADHPWWDTHHVPMHHQCLLGETLVLAHDILAVFKRWYDGDVLVIRTASGNCLTCTPNHPIFTKDGQVAAGLLHVDGNVISRRSVDGMIGGGLNHEDVPTRIEEVARAFFASGKVGSAEVPVSPEDFHGDGKGSKVAVVGTDRLLLNARDPAFLKHRANVDLSISDPVPSLLEHKGRFDLGFHGPRAASDGPVGRICTCKTLLPAHVPHGDGVGAFPSSDVDPRANENAMDSVSGDAKALGNQDFWFSPDVFLDNIVSVEHQLFHGFVYNLHTVSGHYTAAGIVVHNCECKWTPISAEEAEEAGVTEDAPDIDADDGFGAAPSEDGTNWEPDLSGMDPELRRAVEDALADR